MQQEPPVENQIITLETKPPKKPFYRSKVIWVALIVFAIFLGYYYYAIGHSLWPFDFLKQSIQPTPAESKLIGGDRDAHGCIGSAGYQWCETKQKCLRIWEEPCDDVTRSDDIFCTQEAKLCPDGSYVGRTGPNCEFAPCPPK
jgi:hypothetical protein